MSMMKLTPDQQVEQDKLYAEDEAAEKEAFATPEGKRFEACENAEERDDALYAALEAALDATPQGQRWNKASSDLHAFLTTIWAEEARERAERESRPSTHRPVVEGQCSCEDPEPSAQYECGECGEVFNECDEDSNRCPSCNKFASRTDVEVCAACYEEIGEAVAA